MEVRTDELTKHEVAVLVVTTLIVAICSLIYELLISALSTYFMGDSVLHFSLVIGIFMFFMGVGSYLSRYLKEDLLKHLIDIELAVGVLGGLSAVFLYSAFAFTESYYLIAFATIATISMLVGLELPVLTRLIEGQQGLRKALSCILAFDYMGALIASLVFPLILIPYFGILRSSFIVGLLNVATALVVFYEFRTKVQQKLKRILLVSCSLITLGTGAYLSGFLEGWFDSFLYDDEVIVSEQTRYQRVVITKFRDDVRLYLNGSLQFSSVDEYRYHELLVHPAMSSISDRSDVLILGGGDGLAAREVLKYQDVRSVTVVDLDPRVTELAAKIPLLRKLNKDSFQDKRLHIVNTDAFTFLHNEPGRYSVIFIDLPDPSSLSLGKLYSREFYSLVKRRLRDRGVAVTQGSSPYFARKPFWTIYKTAKEVFPQVVAYHSYVPSFGLWGFHLMSPQSQMVELKDLSFQVPLNYLTTDILNSGLLFSTDTSEVATEVSTLHNQKVVAQYEGSFEYWN
jgi:spermidine synthase